MSSELPIHLRVTRVEHTQLSLRALRVTWDPARQLVWHQALLDAARTQLVWMTLADCTEEPLTPLETQPDLSSELCVMYPERWRRPLLAATNTQSLPVLLVQLRYDLL